MAWWMLLAAAAMARPAGAAEFVPENAEAGAAAGAVVAVREGPGDSPHLLAKTPLFPIPNAAGGYTPLERATIVAHRLNVLEKAGLRGGEHALRVGRFHGEVVLYIHDPGNVTRLQPAGTDGPVVLTVDSAMARLAGKPALRLARGLLTGFERWEYPLGKYWTPDRGYTK